MLRGVLPEIDIEASELDVCKVISGVITNFGEEFISCSRYSFEFIEANGKSLYVPAKPAGFQWSGKAVKNLAGNGQVYVRLLYDTMSSSESEDIPSVFQQRPIASDDAIIIDSESPSSSYSTRQSMKQPQITSRYSSFSVLQPTLNVCLHTCKISMTLPLYFYDRNSITTSV